MQLSKLFRFSTYLSMALATVCLGMAEVAEIEGTAPFFIAIGLLLLGSYLTRDRWLMPQSIANMLAIVILLCWLVWFCLGLDSGGGDQLGQLLPRAGPLLGVLLVAKLLRPKAISDYWMLHLLGLVMVMLATVLALQTRMDREHSIFGFCLLAYAISLCWAMLLFTMHREAEAASTISGKKARVMPMGVVAELASAEQTLPWRLLGLGSALSWFAWALLLGLILFFAIPRPGQDLSGALLLPGAVKPQTGFSPGLDLNETAPIEISEQEVMRVEAVDSHGRPVMLDCDNQRWRGVACTEYRKGRWAPARTNDTSILHPRPDDPLNSSEISLRFHLDLTQLQSGWYLADDDRPIDILDRPGNQPVFMAEPVAPPGRTMPLLALESQRDRAATLLTLRNREMTVSAPSARRSRRLSYQQVFTPPDPTRAEWSGPVTFTLQQPPQRAYWESMLALPLAPEDIETLRSRTREILNKSNIGPEPPNLRGEARRNYRLSVARALNRYLSQNEAEYGYTLDRPRQDYNIDPTVDFLVNTKQGHCGLYASALALMLRSQNIPARVVIGFRGARWYSVGEYHSVCQFHAHAWVEAFIEDANAPPIPAAPIPGSESARAGGVQWTLTPGRWLTLDPTPGGGTAAVAGPGSTNFIADAIHFLRYLWEFYVLDYSGDLQQGRLLNRLQAYWNTNEFISLGATLRTLVERMGWPWAITVGLGLLLLLGGMVALLIRSVRRRRGRLQRAFAGFYGRFLQLMERLRLRARPEQTPAEFAAVAEESLARSPTTAEVGSVPHLVVDEFYRIRYGGRKPTVEVQQRVDNALDRLEKSLKGR